MTRQNHDNDNHDNDKTMTTTTMTTTTTTTTTMTTTTMTMTTTTTIINDDIVLSTATTSFACLVTESESDYSLVSERSAELFVEAISHELFEHALPVVFIDVCDCHVLEAEKIIDLKHRIVAFLICHVCGHRTSIADSILTCDGDLIVCDPL